MQKEEESSKQQNRWLKVLEMAGDGTSIGECSHLLRDMELTGSEDENEPMPEMEMISVAEWQHGGRNLLLDFDACEEKPT